MASRMARFVLIALAVFMAGLVSCQAHQGTSSQGSSADPRSPTALPLPNNPCSDTNQQGSQKQSPHLYTALERPEWWLVLLAIPTLWYVGKQARETARAARAAEKSIETSISKERARLQIIANAVTLDIGKTISITYHLKNIGPTTAFLEEGRINLIKGSERITLDYDKCAGMPFTGSIAGSSRTPSDGFIMIAMPAPLTPAQFTEFYEQKGFHSLLWICEVSGCIRETPRS